MSTHNITSNYNTQQPEGFVKRQAAELERKNSLPLQHLPLVKKTSQVYQSKNPNSQASSINNVSDSGSCVVDPNAAVWKSGVPELKEGFWGSRSMQSSTNTGSYNSTIVNETSENGPTPFMNMKFGNYDNFYGDLLAELYEKQQGNVKLAQHNPKPVLERTDTIDCCEDNWIEEMRGACGFKREPSPQQKAAYGVVYRMFIKNDPEKMKTLSQKFAQKKMNRAPLPNWDNNDRNAEAKQFIQNELEETRKIHQQWLAQQISNSIRVKLGNNIIPDATERLFDQLAKDDEVNTIIDYVSYITHRVDLKKLQFDRIRDELRDQCHDAIVDTFRTDNVESYTTWMYGEPVATSSWNPLNWFKSDNPL